jgi:hypothetical protein
VDNAQDLPKIDEHALTVAAPPIAVWRALVAFFREQPAVAARYARLVGASPSGPSGAFPEAGASVAGFRVAEVRSNERLVLTGRHRFSRYTLVLDVKRSDHSTRLRATTYASFPEALGKVYRSLVIRSGAHRFMVRHALRTIDTLARR